MKNTSLLSCRMPMMCCLLLIAAPGLAQVTATGEPTPAPAEPTSTAAPTETPSTATPTEGPSRADLTEAKELVRAGDYAGAETILAELQAQYPEDPSLLLLRGEVLLALQRSKDALAPLEQCVELDPERPRAHFQLATALQASGDRARALQAYARESEINEDTKVKVMARLNRSLLFEQQRDWEGAAGELEAVLQLEPARTEVYGDLATLYLRADRLEDAARSLGLGLEAGYRSAAHFYHLGARYFKKKSFEPATEAFRRTIELDPQNADAVRSLAVALEEMERPDEAVQHFRRYLELRPDAADAESVASRIRAFEER